MNLQRICLRVMLWSLAATAGCGVLAMLTAGHDLLERVTATAAISAVAAGLLIPVTRWLDRDSTRPAALLAMTGVLLSHALMLPAIWNLRFWGQSSNAEELAFSSIIILMVTPFASAFLRALNVPAARVGGFAGLGLCAATLGSWLLAVWLDSSVDQGRWFSTGAALASIGCLALACLAYAPAGPYSHWRWIGVVASAIALVLVLGDVWNFGASSFSEKAAATALAIAIVIAHANLTLLVPLHPHQRWLRIATVVIFAATAALIDFLVVTSIDTDFLIRLAGAGAIVAGCGSLALIVLARINRTVEFESPGAINQIRIICPRCRAKQAISLGGAACEKCNLQIVVQVAFEEPARLDAAVLPA